MRQKGDRVFQQNCYGSKGPGVARPFFCRPVVVQGRLVDSGCGTALKLKRGVLMTRNPKDFWTGLIYIFFGSSAILIARDYGMGTAIKMGPAYFPTILGGLLVVIGAISVIRSFIAAGGPDRGVRVQGAGPGQRVGACVRFRRARRGIGGCYTVARHHQCSRELTISLASDVDHGGGSDNLLRSCVCQRFGHSAADHRSVVRRLKQGNGKQLNNHGIAEPPSLGAANGGYSGQPVLLLRGCFPRHCNRRLARSRSYRHHRHAAARHVRIAAGDRANHAGGHLLWFPVRRFDHFYPCQSPRRSSLCRNDAWTATRWQNKEGRGQRLRLRPSVRFSPGQWRHF